LTVLRKLAVRPKQYGGLFFDESEPHILRHRFGQRFAIQLVQFRLRIKKIDLTRRTFEKDQNASLGLRREVRRLGVQRIRCTCRTLIGIVLLIAKPVRRQQRSKRRGPNTISGITQKIATGLLFRQSPTLLRRI
jgi:hypothetical protein